MATAAEREAATGEKLAKAIKRLTGEATSPERRFHEIFDHAFGFIGLLARDGTVLDVNRTSLEATRLSRDAVIGLPIWDAPCWPADARERLRAAVAVAANGEFVRYETELAAGSEMVALDLSLKPIRDAAGDVVLIIPEARDVTARNRSEAALRESEERFHRIVSITADAIISIDETQRITLFNQGAEQIFGYSAQEVMGQPLDVLLPQELSAAHRRDLREFGASPTIARRIGDRRQISGRRKGGEVFPAEASISKTVVAGKLVFTAVLRDISDRRAQEEERGRLLAVAQAARDEAEAAREEAERAGGRISRLYHQAQEAALQRDHMLGVVSHDLRNPLSAIGMCATALKGPAADAFPERAHLAETIHDSVEWMQRLIADLLDIAGIEAGRLSFDPEPVDPIVIVAKALVLFERIAADKSIRIEISGSELVSAVYADEQRVLQALSNLLANAVKFTEPGGRITMEVVESPEGVIFSVTDTGAGIPAEEVPHVFDRFWHSRRGGGTRGTGLGLAIAKGIVEAHGGRIWVETAKGEGSVFRFTMPGAAMCADRSDTERQNALQTRSGR